MPVFKLCNNHNKECSFPSDKAKKCNEARKEEHIKKKQTTVKHLPDPNITHITCRKCNEMKTVSHYTVNTSNIGGYNKLCRECKQKADKERMIKKSGTTETKLCEICNQIKHIIEFKKKKTGDTDRQKYCMECMSKVHNGKKVCRGCEDLLPLEKFSNRNSQGQKLQDFCKTCTYKSKKGKYKDYQKNYNQKYREDNEVKLKEYHKARFQEKKSEINEKQKQRKKTDIQFRVSTNLRSRVSKALKENLKSNHTMTLLGCDMNFFKEYIEKQFTDGMSWENYGKWHLDHIVPCAYFDLSKVKDQLMCFNYRNMQPLYGTDNITKSDTMSPEAHKKFEELKELFKDINPTTLEELVPKKPFQCNQCPKSYMSQGSLTRHINQNHTKKITASKKKVMIIAS